MRRLCLLQWVGVPGNFGCRADLTTILMLAPPVVCLQVVLHSPDSIAPVGVLHPTAFHIEHKQHGGADSDAADSSQQLQQQQQQSAAVVVEVPDDWQPSGAAAAAATAAVAGSSGQPADVWRTDVQVTASPAHIHITCSASSQQQPNSAAAEGAAFTAADTAAALDAALSAVAAQLQQRGLSWLRSCFVHLYLADMAHFGAANEAYCRHLPQVDPPSRACVQVGVGVWLP